MKIGIVGSRDYPNLEDIYDFVAGLPPDTVVLSGGARGVDWWAEDAARHCGLTTDIYPADWSQGRGAGFARNQLIVDASDCIVAFWDGHSRGTLDTIRKADAANKGVVVFTPK